MHQLNLTGGNEASNHTPPREGRVSTAMERMIAMLQGITDNSRHKENDNPPTSEKGSTNYHQTSNNLHHH
jgi:hypothetical protein